MNYEVKDLMEEIQGCIHNLNGLASSNNHSPRELALVKTKLQEALLWSSLVEDVTKKV